MSILDIINTAWPILLGFITLVIVLAKMHTAKKYYKKRLEHCLTFTIKIRVDSGGFLV